jgi:hypothetical protein
MANVMLEHREDFWPTLTYCLAALSFVTGGWAALQVRRSSGFPAFITGFGLQIVGSLIVVGFNTGGASMWTIGFWIVSAVGWVLGYVWCFSTILLIVHMLKPIERG